ncbi:MAG: SDR family oxidoreductase [Myxococcales bacterium]|nr:SDR family oxidoreductase [Myxococcales bacterium]
MMGDRLAGKRALVTQAEEYMGPAIATLFKAEGAEVIENRDDPKAEGACVAMVEAAGELDILIANLALPPLPAPVGEIKDEDWHGLFDALVHPLMRLVRSAAPRMIARGGGKIVAVTSAAPLRGIPFTSSYCAARGAQNAFVRAVGLELARDKVQLNAIAQNYVKNDTYYPEGLLETDGFRSHLARNVPIKRVAESEESAELALFLASDQSNFIVAQVVPFAGGWVTTA